LLIFLVASAAAGYFATLDDRLSSTQINIASAALKRHQPELFPHDPVFGESGLWRFQTPAVQAPLEMILLPTGYEDPTIGFKAVAGIVAMVYLCGMYALLYRQCRSWSIAAFVAVLSTAITYTLGRSYWGVGSLGSVTPSTLIMAMVPLIVLAYLRYEEHWRVLLVFAFVGLCGNIHLVTAANLAIVLLIVYLGRHGLRPSCWPTAIGCVLCAIGAALPYTGYYLHLRYAAVPEGAQISTAAIYEAFRLGRLTVLYPDMLKSLLYWLLLVLALLIPAGAVLLRVERFRVRDLGVWVWLGAATFVVALLLHGAVQLFGILRGKAPPIIDFAQASSLVMLPLYVLFTQALTNLFRLLRSHRAVLRWACAAFMAAWMVPADNLRVPRHVAYDWCTRFMEPDRRPLRVQELQTKRSRDAELAEIAQWARRNTNIGAVFLIDSAKLRMLSRRSIVACRDDVKYFYYVAPWNLDRWRQRMTRQKAVLRPSAGRASDQAIAGFISELKAEDFQHVTDWYVVLRIKDAPKTPGALRMVVSDRWGRHYRLYKAE